MKYFNSNEKNKTINNDELSIFIEKLSFNVNSCGIWYSDQPKQANYTINDIEFIFYSKGGSITTIMGEEYQCNQHDFMILDPYGLYTSINDGKQATEYYYVHFNIYPPLYEKQFLEVIKQHSPIYTIKDPENIVYLFNKICTENKKQKKGYPTNINSYLRLLSVELLREINKSKESIVLPINKKNTQTELINECISYIQSNLTEDLSINVICKKLGISENYLYKTFKQSLDISPILYIQKARIERSKSIILSQNISMDEVATKVGFSSIVHFSRTFKKIEGISPKQYQKKILNNHQNNIVFY